MLERKRPKKKLGTRIHIYVSKEANETDERNIKITRRRQISRALPIRGGVGTIQMVADGAISTKFRVLTSTRSLYRRVSTFF